MHAAGRIPGRQKDCLLATDRTGNGALPLRFGRQESKEIEGAGRAAYARLVPRFKTFDLDGLSAGERTGRKESIAHHEYADHGVEAIVQRSNPDPIQQFDACSLPPGRKSSVCFESKRLLSGLVE